MVVNHFYFFFILLQIQTNNQITTFFYSSHQHDLCELKFTQTFTKIIKQYTNLLLYFIYFINHMFYSFFSKPKRKKTAAIETNQQSFPVNIFWLFLKIL